MTDGRMCRTGCWCPTCRGFDMHDAAAQRGGEQGATAAELRAEVATRRQRELDRLVATFKADLRTTHDAYALAEQFIRDLEEAR